MDSSNHLRKIPPLTFSVRLLIISAGLLLVLAGCGNPNRQPTSIAATTSPPVATIEPTITTVPGPGLVVHGKVQDLSGAGVENVDIYRSYSAYPGEVIATTDANGRYTSVFYPIPGDEMVTVWAEKVNLEFTPVNCSWRHYYGYEEKECNFELASQ